MGPSLVTVAVAWTMLMPAAKQHHPLHPNQEDYQVDLDQSQSRPVPLAHPDRLGPLLQFVHLVQFDHCAHFDHCTF